MLKLMYKHTIIKVKKYAQMHFYIDIFSILEIIIQKGYIFASQNIDVEEKSGIAPIYII